MQRYLYQFCKELKSITAYWILQGISCNRTFTHLANFFSDHSSKTTDLRNSPDNSSKTSKQVTRQRHKISIKIFIHISGDCTWKEDLLWAFQQKKLQKTSNLPKQQRHRDILFQGRRQLWSLSSCPLTIQESYSFQQEAKEIVSRNATLKHLSKSKCSPLLLIRLHPHFLFSSFSSSFSLYSANKQMWLWTNHKEAAKQHM